MIARLRIPKYQAFVARKVAEQHGSDALQEFLDGALCNPRDIPKSLFRDQLREFRAHVKQLQYDHENSTIQLYPPGRIVQLIRQEEDIVVTGNGCLSCAGSPSATKTPTDDSFLTARWIEREDLGQIALTDHLLSDHQTVNVMSHLEKLADRYNLRPPYSHAAYGMPRIEEDEERSEFSC